MESPYYCDDCDEDSLAPSSNYPQSWSSQSLTSLSSMLPPTDSAIELNNLYLESKTQMLEIIEEGLQLKLEIQGIKNQFLNLVHDFDEQHDNHHVLKSSNMPSDLDAGTLDKPAPKMSAARARVRALYEARKARIRARRSSASTDCQRQLDMLKPSSKVRRLEADDDDDDKENVCKPLADCRNSSNLGRITSTPLTSATQAPLPTMTWSIRKFLTPGKELPRDHSSVNIRCLPKNLLTPRSNSVFRRSSSKSKDKSLGRNLSDSNEKISHYSAKLQRDCPKTSSRVVSKSYSRKAQYRPEINYPVSDQTRRAVRPTVKSWQDRTRDTDRNDSSGTSTNSRGTSSDSILESSHVSHSSDELLEMGNTVKELNDISEISLLSRCEFHEQVSSANISGAFHSTFNYPLHSTLNYPLHSTFSMTSDSLPKDVLIRDCTDATTTVSEPVSSVSHRQSFQHNRAPLFSLPRQTLDDSCMNYDAFVSKMSSKSSCHPERFSPRGYKTSSKKPQAQLCKEHGIHPTFDGSCIFKNRDTIMPNSSDEELNHDENGNTAKDRSDVRETDCDSSYLSEGLDDYQSSIDVDEYAAVHNTRLSCQKILKRQTGQVELKEVKDPVGLSESDLLFDITKKNMSMEATCASAPDNDEMSTLVSALQDDDKSESTLHASSLFTGHPEVMIDAYDPFAGDETLISVEQRPVTLYTNDESPESNTAMPVPVNSPNITDSGGSSGKQNTDNYDYTEMQPQQPSATSDRTSLPGSYTTHSSQSCHFHQARSSQSHRSHHSSKSHRLHHQSSNVHHRHRRRQFASTPSHLYDVSSNQNEKSPWNSKKRHSVRKSSEHVRNSMRNRHHGYDWDSGCSSHGSRSQCKHFTISDNTGRRRTIVPDRTADNLSQTRKHLLAKKLKVFSNSFYKAQSANHLQIHTLGHF